MARRISATISKHDRDDMVGLEPHWAVPRELYDSLAWFFESGIRVQNRRCSTSGNNLSYLSMVLVATIPSQARTSRARGSFCLVSD